MRTPERVAETFKKLRKIDSRLGLTALAIIGALYLPLRPASSQSPDVRPEDLVFVAEDLDYEVLPGGSTQFGDTPGCDSVSAFNVKTGEAIYKGLHQASPGRITSNSDASKIFSPNANYYIWGPEKPSPFLPATWKFMHFLTRNLDPNSWQSEPVVRGYFAYAGGAEVSHDDKYLLVAETGQDDYVDYDDFFYGGDRGPFSVAKYNISEIRSDELGPRRGQFITGQESRPAEIISAAECPLTHIVTTDSHVRTINSETNTETANAVKMDPFVILGEERAEAPPTVIHAALSPDDRYLVVNRWDSPSLNIVDLKTRTSNIVRLNDVKMTAGVAFNHEALNHGLLAVNAGTQIVIYKFIDGALEEVSRHTVERFDKGYDWYRSYGAFENTMLSGPQGAISWSGDGSHLIAAVSDGSAEFEVFEVADNGRTIKRAYLWTACPSTGNFALDIHTLNGRRSCPLRQIYLPRTLNQGDYLIEPE